MPMSQRETEAALLRKGFRRVETHHTYFFYYDQTGRKSPVRTHTSQGARELDDYLIGQMAKQCKLTRQQFVSLVECPLSRADYEGILVAGDHL